MSVATGSFVLNDRPRSPTQGGSGPAHVLGDQWAVQAQPLADARRRLRRELAAHEYRLRSTGRHAHDHEEDDRDADEHHRGEAEPFEDVGDHSALAHAMTSVVIAAAFDLVHDAS